MTTTALGKVDVDNFLLGYPILAFYDSVRQNVIY